MKCLIAVGFQASLEHCLSPHETDTTILRADTISTSQQSDEFHPSLGAYFRRLSKEKEAELIEWPAAADRYRDGGVQRGLDGWNYCTYKQWRCVGRIGFVVFKGAFSSSDFNKTPKYSQIMIPPRPTVTMRLVRYKMGSIQFSPCNKRTMRGDYF